MADITKSQLKVKFNTRLRDTTNVTWTSGEKDDILSAAILDPFVYIVDTDKTLVTVANQPEYTSPVQAITDMQIDTNGDGYPKPVPREAYDLINGVIRFGRAYKGIPAGKTLYVTGEIKLTDFDTYPDMIQEYILQTAMAEAFEMLKTSLTSRFVKNDMTMSEIVQSISTHRAEAARLRSQIMNQRPVTL